MFDYIKPVFKRKNYKELYKNSKTELDDLLKTLKIANLKPIQGEIRDFQIANTKFLKEITDMFDSNGIEYFLDAGTLLGAHRSRGFSPWDDDLDIAMMRGHYEKMLDFCKKNFIELDNSKITTEWYNLDELKNEYMKNNPKKIIFVHTPFDTVIFKGTSLDDMVLFDIFPSDYYALDYSMEKHKKYLKYIKEKRKEFKNYKEIIAFLDDERKNNPDIVEKSDKIYYAIDSFDSYNPARKHTQWYFREDIYPLKEIEFENIKFKANNNIEKKLKLMYGADFETFPQKLEFAPTYKLFKYFAKNPRNIKKFYKNKKQNNKRKNYSIDELFKNINAQKQIDKLAKKLKNKKIIIYGAGLYACYVIKNYDLKGLNITAVADKKFISDKSQNPTPYKAIEPDDIINEDFDEIFTLLLDDSIAKDNLEDNILIKSKYQNKKVKPLIKTKANAKTIKKDNNYYKKLYLKTNETLENLKKII